MRLDWRSLLRMLGVALLTYVTGRLGLLVPFSRGNASPVWPPSGISLAAVLAFGPGVWPGVALGSLLTTLTIGVGLPVAIGVTVGNVCEPLLGAFLLRHVVRFRPTFERLEDAIGFVVLAAMLSTAVSATCGVGSLWLGGVIDRPHVVASWLIWWTGNGMGVLLVTPMLLIWRGPRLLPPVSRWRVAALGLGTVACLVLVFGPFSPVKVDYRQETLLFPFLIWAALDHGARGSLVASVGVTAFALWRTASGDGPFVRPLLWESVWLVQTFSAASTLTVLVLGAVLIERRRAVDLRDEFIAIASHELKTPLTTLHLTMDELRVGAASQPEVQRMSTGMQHQLDRLGSLVDTMLDIARLAGGALSVDREPVDLAALARTIADRSAELFVASGATLELLAGEPVVCACDRLRIEQVLSNLLSNAAKYGNGRPVTLEVRRAGNEALVVVVDHGAGIAPEDHQRIFQRFERATTDRAISGFGLGLYIVGQVVEAHGGRVELDSASGMGARFTVRLPLAAA